MKYLLFIVCILLGSNVFAQIYSVPEDALVNIYIIPFGLESLVSEPSTSDYVRVHAHTKITLTPCPIADELFSKMHSIKKELLYKRQRCDYDRCKMVIDFVKGDYIYYSMTISYGFDFFIDYSFRNKEVDIFKEDMNFMYYLKKCFLILFKLEMK